MGTYEIPRNLRGETRILYIFSIKSLITAAIGAFIGLLFSLLFSMFGLNMIGTIMIAVFGVIGFGVGTIKIPTLSGVEITKKIGGESLDQIILRYFKFRKNKKMYIYTKEEE